MNNQDRVSIYFEDMSLNSTYEILEEGKNNDELQNVASKSGLKLPCKDLAVFKCSYAMVDKENKNKCTLPKKEVKKALDTLTGKAVDRDHLRKSIFGTWLDAKLENDTIFAYGSFFKSSFPDEYEEIKKRIKEGKLKISFEAWGNRIFKENGSYDLTDIEFAGGALLFDTQPAFPDAEVLEFSKYTDKILEFAKIKEEVNTIMEESKLNFNFDNETIARMLYETECPSCKMKGWHDIQMIDFGDNKVKSRCPACQGINMYDLTPSATIVKKGKKPEGASFEDYEDSEEKIEMCYAYQLEGSDFIDEIEEASKKEKIKKIDDMIKEMKDEMEDMTDEDEKDEMEMKIDKMMKKKKMMTEGFEVIEDAKKLSYKERQNISDDKFAVVVTVKNKKSGELRKIRMFPIQDEPHVRNALARLPQATETLKKLGVSVEEVKKKILKRAKELKMTDLLKRHKEGGTEVNELLSKYNKASVEELIKFIDETSASVTAKDTELASLKQEVADSKLKIENSNLELEKVKNDAKLIKEQLDARITTEKANVIASRRKDLDEDLNKAMTDDDILNDLKFENAKLKLALKKANIEVSNITGLDAGQRIVAKDAGIFASQKSIQDQAFKK